jgi:all-trans-retinol 13,14-reductase
MYDAIIIGAGLGGLSAGAFLAKAGKKVLVLEKTGFVGGRCRTVELMGRRFDIGADYFGRKMLRTFRQLGREAEVWPLGFRTMAYSDGASMTIPPGTHTVGDLRGMGMGGGEIARFGYRMGRQLLFGAYKDIQNNYELVYHIAENRKLRDILNIGAFFTGNDPENMPGYWFKLIFGNTYGYNRPFYPKGGAESLPDILADIIKENGGGIVFHAKPTKVIIKDGRAKYVVLDGREVETDSVISGIGVLPTVHSLVGKEHFPAGFMNTVGYYKEGLSMASVFVVFSRKAKIKKKTHIYARFSGDMRAMFRVLKEGAFPENNMFILSCPDAVTDPGTEHLAGTVKFLIPRGVTERAAIEVEAGKILRGVNSLVPDFYESMVDGRLYTPKDYYEKFGFVSTVTPVAESVNYPKLPVETPIPGLYMVGSTVLPVGGCAASAMESGRVCARKILKKR